MLQRNGYQCYNRRPHSTILHVKVKNKQILMRYASIRSRHGKCAKHSLRHQNTVSCVRLRLSLSRFWPDSAAHNSQQSLRTIDCNFIYRMINFCIVSTHAHVKLLTVQWYGFHDFRFDWDLLFLLWISVRDMLAVRCSMKSATMRTFGGVSCFCCSNEQEEILRKNWGLRSAERKR